MLDHLGLYKDALQFCDWLEVAEWFDSRGPKKTGDLLVTVEVAVPQNMTDDERKAVEALAAATDGRSPRAHLGVQEG